MSKNANLIIKGSILRVTNLFANIIIAFFMMPFLIHSLGDKWYGIWTFVATFIGFYGYFDMGITTAVSRFISRSIGKGDSEESNRILNTGIFLFLIVGTVLLFITIGIAYSARFFINDPNVLGPFRKSILLMGLGISIGMPFRAIGGVLVSNLRHDLITVTRLLKLIIRTVLIFLLISMGYKIVALSLLTLCIELFGCLLTLYFVYAKCPGTVISRKLISFPILKELYHYGAFRFIAQIAEQSRFNIDTFIISWGLGATMITFYAIPMRLTSYFLNFMAGFMGHMEPIYSRYDGANKENDLRSKFLFTTKIAVVVVVLISAIIIATGQPFIERWMGIRYVSVFPVLVILTFAIACELIQMPSISVMYAVSKHKFLTYSNIVESAIHLVLGILLVKNYGLTGIAIAFAVPIVVIKMIFQPVYICKVTKINLAQYYWLLIKSCCVCILVVALGYVGLRGLLVANYLKIVSFSVALMIPYSVVCFVLIINREEKKYFYNFAHALVAKFKKK